MKLWCAKTARMFFDGMAPSTGLVPDNGMKSAPNWVGAATGPLASVNAFMSTPAVTRDHTQEQRHQIAHDRAHCNVADEVVSWMVTGVGPKSGVKGVLRVEALVGDNTDKLCCALRCHPAMVVFTVCVRACVWAHRLCRTRNHVLATLKCWLPSGRLWWTQQQLA